VRSAAIGFVLPDFCCDPTRRGDATNSTAICSAYLDLVTILLAGGRGVGVRAVGRGRHRFGVAVPPHSCRVGNGATSKAGRRGPPWMNSPTVSLCRRCASSRRASRWPATAAPSSGLAHRQGASLRDRQLATPHAAAERASEQMSLPVVALLVAFLLLIGYPAIANVLAL